MKKSINYHLDRIKDIQSKFNQQFTQAMINLDAMHQACGGTLDDKGNYVMDREKAIAYFANNKHKDNYCTPDEI